jgi:hypothetical protein
MWIRQGEDGREWVVTPQRVNGKTLAALVPLEEFNRKQEASRMAKEKRAADEKAAKERQVAEAEQERRADKRAALTSQEATLILARRGNKKVLPMLRQALDEHPELWQHFGNLALQTQESWLQLIAGTDLLLAEAMRRHLDAMRTELAGPNPSPLDRLLVDRILACHVQVLYFEAMETTDPTAENTRLARYRMDRRDQAHRQFLSAVKMLATVRNLMARTNVIQVEFLHPPMVHSPAAPIMPHANGEQPPTYNGRANGVENRFNGDTTKPVNGYSRINGHNRISDLLMPAGAGVNG